jgi:peptidoglycan/LPS O-acetylase OafA/YrhL
MLLLLGLRSPLLAGNWAGPLRFLGYISYGLYLIHGLIFGLYDQTLQHFANSSNHLLQSPLVRFFICATLSISIAWISRKFYEEPFLRMGRRSTQPHTPALTSV